MNLPLGFGLPSGPEMIVILIVGLLVFGGRLPEIARSLGRGLAELRRGMNDVDREFDRPIRKAMTIAPPDRIPYQPPAAPPAPPATPTPPPAPPSEPPAP